MDKNSHHRNRQLLNWTYYTLGGIYTSSRFSKTAKLSWFISCALMIFLVDVIGAIGYLLTTDVITLLDIISVTFMPGVTAFVLGGIPFITFCYHREIETFFKYIENCLNNVNVECTLRAPHSVLIKKVDSVVESLQWLKLTFLITAAYISVGAVDILFFCTRENSFRNLQHHIFPMPYLESIPTMFMFWLLYAIESIILVFACVAGLPEVTFVSMITNEVNNIVAGYCQQMQSVTEYMTIQLENFQEWDMESLMVRTVHEKFEKNFRSFAENHRKMIEMVSLIRPYIEIFDTILLVTIFNSMFVCIYLLLLTDLDYALKFKQVVAVWIASLYLYPHCELGTRFNFMNDAMILQVYNLPWYYLPPRRRKQVHILLCQVQRPIQFQAFMVYPVDLVTFPKVMKSAYSYTSLLRHTIKTGHYSLSSS